MGASSPPPPPEEDAEAPPAPPAESALAEAPDAPGVERESPGGAPRPRWTTRRRLLLALPAALAAGAGLYALFRFPPDTKPEGAYMRIAFNVSRGLPRECFAYLEDRAQHAAYSIRDYRRKASERIAETYPEPERTKLLEAYRKHAEAEDGADVFADLAESRGFVSRLRKDLSGVAKVEIAGERATIETARGTRYSFRRRENGIWGLTLFTGELVAEAERAARDWDVVERAAADYERGR